VGRLPGAARLLTLAGAGRRWEANRTFERFTDQARQVIVDAQTQARDLRHNYIGTEHLLLGVLAREDREPAGILRAQGVDLDAARACLATIVPAGEGAVVGQIPFTPRAKKTLELSLRESLSSGSGRVLPHHLLLGLLSEGEGVASQILRSLGVDLNYLRAAVVQSLPPPEETEVESRTRVMRSRHGGVPPMTTAMAGYHLELSPDVRRLLMSAGARALDDSRTQIEIADVEEALRRRGGSEEPPRASTA
jgi:ATP-dependent Clp protease ATP-binding subunit ClpA